MKHLFLFIVLFSFIDSVARAQERLSQMSIPKRDSILVEIVQKVLKEKYPKCYREKGITPRIDEGVYEYDASYYKNISETIPNYVKKGDIFYMVTLYYDKAKEEKFEYFYTAMMVIQEKTRRPSRIHLGEFNIGYRLLDESERQK